MKSKLFFILVVAFFLLIPVTARDYETIDDFFEDIPSINSELQSQEIILPSYVGFLISNGNVLVDITMSDEAKRNFYIAVKDKKIDEISLGTPNKKKYIVSSDEETVNEILGAEDTVDAILTNYREGEIKLKAVGAGNKVKMFFARIFIKAV